MLPSFARPQCAQSSKRQHRVTCHDIIDQNKGLSSRVLCVLVCVFATLQTQQPTTTGLTVCLFLSQVVWGHFPGNYAVQGRTSGSHSLFIILFRYNLLLEQCQSLSIRKIQLEVFLFDISWWVNIDTLCPPSWCGQERCIHWYSVWHRLCLGGRSNGLEILWSVFSCAGNVPLVRIHYDCLIQTGESLIGFIPIEPQPWISYGSSC